MATNIFNLNQSPSWIYMFLSSVFLILITYFFAIAFQWTRTQFLYVSVMVITGIALYALYYSYEFYDKSLHFFLPILIFNFLLIHYRYYPETQRFYYAYALTLLLIVAFEFFEYIALIFDPTMAGVWVSDGEIYVEKMDRYDDTMIDIALGFLGTSLYAFFWTRNKQIYASSLVILITFIVPLLMILSYYAQKNQKIEKAKREKIN